MNILIHTDGGARGNPGPAAIGVVIKTDEQVVITELSQRIGWTTNNVAEYWAIIAALEWLKKNRALLQEKFPSASISCSLDSSLVVNQLNGLFKIKDAKLRELLYKVKMLEQGIARNITYTYIPREQNIQADTLVNQALDIL